MEGNRPFWAFFLLQCLYLCLSTYANVFLVTLGNCEDFYEKITVGTFKEPEFLLSIVTFRLNKNGCLEHL